jgi:hypothetical protein
MFFALCPRFPVRITPHTHNPGFRTLYPLSHIASIPPFLDPIKLR